VVSNGAIQGTTIGGSGTATFASVVSNGAIQGTTITSSGNTTVSALTVNGSATIGTTLSVNGGLQNTPIGNGTASSGSFTTADTSSTFTACGAVRAFSSIVSTGTTTGALQVQGGAGITGAINAQSGNLGNITHSNVTISSNLTNTGITINPNGTGTTVINSGLNNSQTIINGSQANTLVVSGTAVAVNTASLISGASFQVATTDSILLPVGTQGQRPGSPSAGMFRYSTTAGGIEWYTGTAWATGSTAFTIITANTQTGNGSATTFTLPVANATTAGTIVSINGIVQQPTTSYSVTGANVTFTEAPSTNDVIDFRVLTTTTSVTSVVDAVGTTGLFLDTPTVGNKVVLFRTNGAESLSIQANNEVQVTGNITPTANITYGLGSSNRRWKDLWLSGSTIYLGNVQIKETAGTVSFYAADGTSLAPVNADVADLNGIQNTPIGNATPNTGNFTTLQSSSNLTASALTVNNSVTIGSTLGVTGNVTILGNLTVANITYLNQEIVSNIEVVAANLTANGLTINTSATVGTTLSATGGIQNTPIGNASASSGTFTTVNASGAITGATTLTTTGNATINNLTVNSSATIPTLGVSTSFTVPSISHSGTTGTGDIGSSGSTFATVYATTFSGVSTTAKYADLAENYLADATYQPGTVVIFGGDKEITVSSAYADPRVAGVVSTNPAYLMNSGLTGGTPVAFTGRVPCQVMGPVNKGDLLVQGGNYGIAEALNPDYYVPGCIIGKSLENIPDRTIHLIEVVVGRF
jgi:hypothetical protein